MSSQQADEAREVAKRLNKAKEQLDFAVEALWDARDRGHTEDFEFYQSAVGRCAAALTEWANSLGMKPKKENGR